MKVGKISLGFLQTMNERVGFGHFSKSFQGDNVFLLWEGSSAYVTGHCLEANQEFKHIPDNAYYGYNNQHTFLGQKTSLA